MSSFWKFSFSFVENLNIMEATFKIQSNEFDDSLIERIRSYINGSKDVEITVNIRSKKPQPPTQTREEYFAQLDRAIKEANP